MAAHAPTSPVPSAAKAELTPTGKLRAGINFQNMLLTTRGPNGEQGGVAVEFARELARRLEVPLDIIVYESAGSLADSVSANAWDISVLGIEPKRAEEITFAPPLTEIESTYLVPAGSPLQNSAEVDRPGIRIALAAGSAYALFLNRTIKHAQLVQVEGLDAAQEHFAHEKLEVLAGLKPALLEFMPTLAGSRLLEGNFYVVRHTVGTPKGRPAADAYLHDLVEEVKATGLVTQWIEKSGVKGLSVAPPSVK
jgi:polar amino acid transport system substrate-binding protein